MLYTLLKLEPNPPELEHRAKSFQVGTSPQCNVDKNCVFIKINTAMINFIWGQQLGRVLPLTPKEQHVNSFNPRAMHKLETCQPLIMDLGTKSGKAKIKRGVAQF